jgi:hypothetical protein
VEQISETLRLANIILISGQEWSAIGLVKGVSLTIDNFSSPPQDGQKLPSDSHANLFSERYSLK